jgi:hypothetical protein
MSSRGALTTLALLLTFVAGYVSASLGSARAEPQPAFDRALAERLVRAQEEQAREQEGQRRALEALTREIERCKR